MSAAHRAGALAKMKEHHAEAVRLRASDPAASRRAAAAATHAADVVRSLDSGTIVGTASSVDFSPSSSVSGGTAGTSTSSSTSTDASTSTSASTAAVGAWTGSETAPDVRGGYNPGEGVDMTNTNPSYWASAVRYFTAHPQGNPTTGELGIWIPNLEKEGNERVALAAIAGGVTAHVGSNYSNNTIDNAYAQKLHRDRGDTAGAEGTYNTGGAEKVIRLAGTHRGGVKTDTGYAMGSTAPSEHGVHIKGGKVVKAAGGDYVEGGGDFGGLLSRGDAITGDWLTGILGGMDKDGMRIGGTYPAVRGATGSGVGAGGTDVTVGGTYAGGVDPLASIPKVADYTAYMDPNSIFSGLSDNASVKSGLLYQPMASDYGAKMEAAGMPAFSPGLLGAGGGATGGVGSVTYGSPVSGFMKPKAGATATGTSSTMIGSPSAKYALPEMYGKHKFSRIPTFYDLAALEAAGDVWRSRGGAWKGSPWLYEQPALVGGHKLYTSPESDSGVWDLTRTYPLAET
jgi:hypothetical protein